jgi:DNA modification methylase
MLNQTATSIDSEEVRFQPNAIYCGDCEYILKQFPERCIDLIYADPPFFSNRNYEILWNDGYELRSFEDRWRGGLDNYVAWMVGRLRWCNHVLKDTGSIYLHCDHHASHYLKVEMDKIFGESNFRNEIIWKRTSAHSGEGRTRRSFGGVHDTILFYSKSDDYTFNSQFVQ